MGNIHYFFGDSDRAQAAYDMALILNPNHISTKWRKCVSHIPIIYKTQEEIHFSRNRYYEGLLQLKDSIPLDTSENIESAVEAVGSSLPFYLACQGFNDKELQQIYGELVSKIMNI